MSWLAEFEALLAEGQWERVEEFWLSRLEQGAEDPDPFLAASLALRRAGRKKDASLLLELALEQAREQGAWKALRAFAEECLRLGIGQEAQLRADLEQALRQLWAGRPSLERLLAHFNLRTHHNPVEACEELEIWLRHDVGEVFAMAGRGPGRVVEVNPQVGVLRLDFEREKRFPMPILAAPKNLTPLPPGHFLRRRLEEPQTLREQLLADPPAGLLSLLRSFPQPLTVAEIREAVGGLLSDEEWAAWWGKARKAQELVTEGRGSGVRYRALRPGEADEELLRLFASAPLGQKVELARRAKKGSWVAEEMAQRLVAEASAAAPEEAFAALAAARRLGAAKAEVAGAWQALRQRVGALELLAALSDTGDRETVLLQLAEEGDSETLARWLERETHPRLLHLVAQQLLQLGQEGLVQKFFAQVFLHPARFAAAWVWALELEEGPLAAMVAEKKSAASLLRLVDAGERKEFAPYRARIRALISPHSWVGKVLREGLTEELARRLYHILQSPGVLREERAWLRRVLLSRFPQLAGAPPAEETVPALPQTVQWLQEQLATLLYKEIPATLKAIQAARAEGDLRENFEYHAQRERQEQLSSRAAKIQADLARIQIVDPSRVDASEVRVGCEVELVAEGTGERRRVILLGPYEADPQLGIFSHASQVGQTLLGKSPGSEVSLEGQRYRISKIAPVDPSAISPRSNL
ncbi:MAG: GreA/GreB family elongation factor [Thermoanaerobaculum sp.]|nr:GreA/GreB family elongation factor [Thermoanaerobaculum sp.]